MAWPRSSVKWQHIKQSSFHLIKTSRFPQTLAYLIWCPLTFVYYNTLLCVIRSAHDNETAIAPLAEPLENIFELESTSASFGLNVRPCSSQLNDHTGGDTCIMTQARDTVQVFSSKNPPTLEEANLLFKSEWSQQDRDALALGLYLFKAGALGKVCSIVGSKTVSPKSKLRTRESIKALPAWWWSLSFWSLE